MRFSDARRRRPRRIFNDHAGSTEKRPQTRNRIFQGASRVVGRSKWRVTARLPGMDGKLAFSFQVVRLDILVGNRSRGAHRRVGIPEIEIEWLEPRALAAPQVRRAARAEEARRGDRISDRRSRVEIAALRFRIETTYFGERPPLEQQRPNATVHQVAGENRTGRARPNHAHIVVPAIESAGSFARGGTRVTGLAPWAAGGKRRAADGTEDGSKPRASGGLMAHEEEDIRAAA